MKATVQGSVTGEVKVCLVNLRQFFIIIIFFFFQLPKEIVLASFSPLVNLLSSKSNVVHSYAANAIERLLILKSPSRQQM